jgi:hypothetical protein
MRLRDYLEQQGIPTSAAAIRGVTEWREYYAKVAPPIPDLLREELQTWSVGP